MSEQFTYSAHGKFLITGEYVVLDHVPALAIPLKLDQYLKIIPRTAVTTLDFNRTYGMGTSSTLVSLIAQWLECDPYALQFECFGGSGYDIACATARQPLIYKYHELLPEVETVDWIPAIKDQLFFVYLNRKQNSRDSIARFDKRFITPSLREELITMPQQFMEASKSLAAFEEVTKRHEVIIGALIGLESVQSRLFPDYSGAIKSLGGWGGDFVMATGDVSSRQYFIDKGYDVIYGWDDLIL